MRVHASSLPIPRRERWQPLRSGFVNLYRYDQEEFQYENGRLLLRGNNGTGKSRVLALQLPFLFDGEVNPERLEPDADPSKKMEWNLLMGSYPDRTGYTWIEFGRSDEDGKLHYLTIGSGLSAVEGQSGVRQWFFITTQRIGKDLELASDSKQVLGMDRLRGKIGSAGRVFDNAAEYRRGVNESLFRLDEYRYASLMNLLIQLRRPQLTRKLEERELSRALSEALAPLSPDLVANVAESFRVLEYDRSQWTSSRSALAAVEQFLIGYRGYAEVAAKRYADRILSAHDEYETAMKEILAAESECDRSLAGLALLKSEMQRLANEEHVLQSEISALQRIPNKNDALDLEQVHREADEKRRDAESAAAELADSLRARKSCADENIRVRAILEQYQLRWDAVKASSEHAAISAGLEEVHRNCLGSLNIQTAGELDLNQIRERIDSAIRTQIESVECLSILNERIEVAKMEFQRASANRDQISGLLDDARERLNTARREHQAAVTSFLGAASDWTAELIELPLPYDESFLHSVGEWCDRPQGPNPFTAASRKVFEELILSFSETRAELKQLEKNQYSELNRLDTEHERLAIVESAGSPESVGLTDAWQRGRQLELEAAVAEAHSRLDRVIDSIHELNRREDILRSEVHSAPPDDGVRTTYDYSVALSRHLDSVRSRMVEAEEYVSQKQSQVDQVVESRRRAASELGMDGWIENLHAIEDGIVQYRLELSSVWSGLESLQEARRASAWATTSLEQSTARELRHREIASQLEQRAVAAEIARDAAGQTANASSSEILERLSRARSRLESLRIEEKQMRRRYHDTEVAVTRLDERLRSRTVLLNGETDRRDTVASSLRVFASTGLLELAAPGLDGRDALTWSTTRTIEVAYELASRLDSIDAGDSAWEHHQKSVPSQFTTLMRALSAEGCKISAVFCDDLFVATAFFAGEERTMDQLRLILLDDVSSRQMLLDARAGEILDIHLMGGVSSHLRELLLAAEEQVRQMNIELESRPMSTGMKLRFVWRPSEFAPSGMAEARQRLMQLDGAWSPAERQMVGKFLQQQIEAVFSDIEGASWQESLAEALDYRKWHQFGVERYQDSVWTRLTHRTFGTGSGGEKAVALTLPHFAAAAAFYRTADPLAPRLILLDEAFVGIDADMRAKCMGLIHVFDLDFIMTSEREWGCYQTLPGIAIYHLSTRPGIDAIGLSRWVWNGRQRNLVNNAESNLNEVPYENREGREGPERITVESPQT